MRALSRLLAPDGQVVRSLLWGQSVFPPFDPRKPAGIPELSRYGFELDFYRRQLDETAP